MEHPKRVLYQIGISNVIEGRIKTHEGKGWFLIGVSTEMLGAAAYDYEQGGRHAIVCRGDRFTVHRGKEEKAQARKAIVDVI